MNRATKHTMLLKDINHDEIVKKYLRGEYKDIDLPVEKPTFAKNFATKSHIQEVGVGRSERDSVYERVVNSTTYRVYTTNSDLYNTYAAIIEENGILSESISSSSRHYCDHCRQLISGDMLVVPLFVRKHGSKTLVYGNLIAGHSSCALALIRNEARAEPHNHQWRECERLLKSICLGITGSIPEYPAPHWKLLSDNGGSMPADVFYNGDKEFKTNPNYICLPVKAQSDTKVNL